MKLKGLILIAGLILLLGTCGCNNSVSGKPVKKEQFLMGTIIEQKVYGDNASKAIEQVAKRMEEIEDAMTINAEGGDINALNSAAGKNEVIVRPDVMWVLETAKRFAGLSQGTFDVTVGPLVEAWAVFTDHPRVPSKEEIKQLKSLVGYNELQLDRSNLKAFLARSGQMVDVGGIAKGYAGDEAIRIYKENEIKSAFVNLGGNVVALGKRPDGELWNIGIQNPRAANGAIVALITVEDKAVVSSGDYERYFMKDDIRYHHIIDPRTGYPADSGLIGTTIVADKSIEADALSTATFVLGLEKGMELIKSLPGVDAIFITKEKKVYVTDGLKKNFKMDDDSNEYIYVEKG